MYIMEELYLPIMKNSSEYFEDFIEEPSDYVSFLRESDKIRTDICPSIGKLGGNLLSFFIKLKDSQNILEVGSSIGYSTLWICSTIKKVAGQYNRKFTTIERSERLALELRENLKNCHQLEKVNIVIDQGESFCENTKDFYDFVFVDSSSKSYLPIFKSIIDKVTAGGLIIFEDVSFAVNGVRESQKKIMDEFNRFLSTQKGINILYLPFGDGFIVIEKENINAG